MLSLPVLDSLLLLFLLLLQIPFHIRDLVLNEVQLLIQLLVFVAVDVMPLSWAVQLQVCRRLLLLLYTTGLFLLRLLKSPQLLVLIAT